MIKLKKTAAMLCVISMCAGMLSACGSKENKTEGSDVNTPAAAEGTGKTENRNDAIEDPEATPAPEAATQSFFSKEWYEGVAPRTIFAADDEYMDAAFFEESDNRALADVMKKAKKGEDITIVTLGGSITQGTISRGSNDSSVKESRCYADLVSEWWTKCFPDTKINFVNAGIGATTSYLGVHRAKKDVLAYKPDLVIVEFAVNDAGLKGGQTIYDNLVRSLLNSESAPAVMLLFMGQTNGSTAQADELPIGQAYSLPMISYSNVINAMMKNGTHDAKELSGDTVHPSSMGHAICGELFWYYFNAVYYDLDKYDPAEDFSAPAFTSEKYTNATTLDNLSITPDDYGSFAECSVFSHYPNDWSTESGEDGISFTINCSNLGLIYYRTTNGKSGQFDIIVDGETVSTLDADFSGGWGNYAESAEVFSSDTAAEHKVVIKKNDSSANSGFSILGLLVSGGDAAGSSAANDEYADYVSVHPLSNPDADGVTRHLYDYLFEEYGTAMLSCQQESTWMGSPDYEMDYIEKTTGRLPAMRGLDFMNDDFRGVTDRAKKWWNEGGIVTICWHTGVNGKGYNESLNDNPDFEKLLTEGTPEYNAMTASWDKAAIALTELRDAGIPVLWRPFHEFDGQWFWWGKGGSENFIRLWQMMYDYFTDKYELTNLIWVLGYSGEVKSNWYPGDEYCDIIGSDTYDGTTNAKAWKKLEKVSTDKLYAFHECGNLPTVDAFINDGDMWSWFMIWHTDYITGNDKDNLIVFYNSESVITLDELPGL